MEKDSQPIFLSVEESLESLGFNVQTSRGHSMMPFLHPGDRILVRRKEGRVKKYEIAVYKSFDMYITHRCISVGEHDYVFAGDHNAFKDPVIPEDRVIAVVAKVLRGREEIRMDGWRYRLYCHLWVDFFPIRCMILRIKKYFRNDKKEEEADETER